MKVKAPPRVVAGIAAVRETGAVDLRQVETVRSLAKGLGFPETAFWLEIRPDEYLRGLESGFESDSRIEVGRIGGWPPSSRDID